MTIRRLVSANISKAIRFMSKTFVESEPTSVALKFTTCDFTTAFQDVMRKCVIGNQSFAIFENKEILAQSLSVDYETFSNANYGYTRETQPMFDLFEKLEIYKPSKKSLVIFGISSTVEKKGYASKLIDATINSAKTNGFEMIIADCTNIKSQNLFEKFGFETVVEIDYKTFEYGIKKPFSNIMHTTSLKRMVLNI